MSFFAQSLSSSAAHFSRFLRNELAWHLIFHFAEQLYLHFLRFDSIIEITPVAKGEWRA